MNGKKSMPIGKLISRMLLYFVVFDICMLILYPYFVMFCTALKSRAEIFSINGTILPIDKAVKFVEKYSNEAAITTPLESSYRDQGKDLD